MENTVTLKGWKAKVVCDQQRLRSYLEGSAGYFWPITLQMCLTVA